MLIKMLFNQRPPMFGSFKQYEVSMESEYQNFHTLEAHHIPFCHCSPSSDFAHNPPFNPLISQQTIL
jgi:hypothetical protein